MSETFAEEMKNKIEKMLPKTTPESLPGSVHAQSVRCGKPSCKCASGKLHEPYFYHFYRLDGRLTKRYLKADEVEQVRQACEVRQQTRKQQLANIARDRSRFRQVNTEIREFRRQLNNLGNRDLSNLKSL